MNLQRPSLEAYLSRELQTVRKRLVSKQVATWTAALWVFLAFLIWLVADAVSTPLDRTLVVLLLSASGLMALVGAILIRRWSRALYQSSAVVAKPIENRFPELDSRLFAAVEQSHTFPNRPSGFLHDQVVKEVLVQARRQQWSRVVPGWQLWTARGANVSALLLIVAAGIAVCRAPFTVPALAGAQPNHKSPVSTSPDQWVVTPGDIELQRGRSLLVTVELPAPSPDPLELVVQSAGDEVARYSLVQNLSDPIYSAQVSNIQQDLVYRIATTRSSTRDFYVTVFELPELEQLNIELSYPEFTRMSPKTILDPRRVQAVEGTELRMTARFNQPLRQAIWEGPAGSLEMSPVAGEPNQYEATLKVRESERLDLAVESRDGRSPAAPTSLKITALPNHPAEVRWLQPGYDPQISPLEEVDVAGSATDDFGVVSVGLTFQFVGREPIELRLDEDVLAAHPDQATEKVKAEIRQQVAMESMSVKPGDLMQMYLWAEDRIEGNEIRRTLSDLLVAEVRDFEQIFRQSDQPNDPNASQQQQGQQPGQQGQQQQAQDLIERQKQVLLASWNLLRRETESANWTDDVQLVLEEQMAIIDEVRPLLQEVSEEDLPADQRLLLEQAMVDSIDGLLKATQQQINQPLKEVTEAQQVLLQAMLQFVGNEFDVQQQQQQSGQQSSPSSSRQAGTPRQQQLQQLQLDNDRNRYEQESEAQELTDPEQQQARERLNRLEDLARRQEDLNEQIKQLQAELEAAETTEEQEELKRRLERLREEQERLMRDAEQLQEELASDPNASRQEQQQLEEARQSAQQSAQSLSEENLDQALAEGRRTEQALDELRDEYQQKTGEAFREELRRLNQQLRELNESQQGVEDKLDDFFNENGETDLRDRDRSSPLLEQMQDRNARLEQALNDLRSVIEASEESEPLLSDELYDVFREAKQQQLEQIGDDSQRWVENNLPERSIPLEEALGEQLNELQQAVQRSSQFAGNDDISALRMAESTLRELSAQADPNRESQSPGQSDSESQTDANSEDRLPGEGESSDQERPADEESQDAGGEDSNQSPRGQTPNQPGEPGENQEGQSGENRTDQEPMGANQPGQNPMGQSPMGQSPMGQGGRGQEDQEPASSEQPGQPSPMGQSPMGGAPTGSQNPQGATGGNPQSGGNSRRDLSAQQLLDQWSQLTGPGGNPLTTDAYREWIDRLREVEDLVPAGPLSEEATRIRQRAEEMRRDLQRHSIVPDPEDIEAMIVKPLDALARRVADERIRLEGKDESVRLDKDPVPAEFADEVREYFQRLGAGRE